MTFGSPIWLVGLLLVPALGLGWVLLDRRRRHDAEAFARPALQPNILTGAPGGRRYVPVALALASFALLVVGVARPHVTRSVTRDEATIVLAIDTSLSMQADDVTPDRATAARNAAGVFLDTVPDGVAVGVVTFDGRARLAISPTTRLDAVRRTIEKEPSLGEGTAIGEAVFLGLDVIDDALGVLAAPSHHTTTSMWLPSDIWINTPGRRKGNKRSASSGVRHRFTPSYTASIVVSRIGIPSTRSNCVPNGFTDTDITNSRGIFPSTISMNCR